jgi:lysozyme family protein
MELDSIHPDIRLIIVDSGVNQGVHRASRFVQEIVGTTQDGIIGNQTLVALKKYIDQKGQVSFLREMFILRFIHYSMLDKFYYFGKGWTKRLCDIFYKSIENTLSN